MIFRFQTLLTASDAITIFNPQSITKNDPEEVQVTGVLVCWELRLAVTEAGIDSFTGSVLWCDVAYEATVGGVPVDGKLTGWRPNAGQVRIKQWEAPQAFTIRQIDIDFKKRAVWVR